MLVLLECTAAGALAMHFGVADQIPWGLYFFLWLIPAAIAGVITVGVWLYRLARAQEQQPIRATISKLRGFNGRSYVEVIVPVVVMAPFMASFTAFKSLMENIAKPTMDPMLSRIDAAFGIQPWQITHALISPLGTLIIDRLYFVWLAVSELTLVAVLFVPHLRPHRGQVLLTFVVSWLVLGVLVASLLPSVGPCYYGKLYHPDAYAELLRQLGAIGRIEDLKALGIQNRLWADHTRELITVGSGVSAMPSMHVSIATVTALFLRRVGLGWLGAFWLAAILIGSVHLGWHYASDGLVSIVGTLLIWKCVSYALAEQAPE